LKYCEFFFQAHTHTHIFFGATPHAPGSTAPSCKSLGFFDTHTRKEEEYDIHTHRHKQTNSVVVGWERAEFSAVAAGGEKKKRVGRRRGEE
jgi:hypothetical protein